MLTNTAMYVPRHCTGTYLGRKKENRHTIPPHTDMQLLENLVGRIENSEQLSVYRVTGFVKPDDVKEYRKAFPLRERNDNSRIKPKYTIPECSLGSKGLKLDYYKANNRYKRKKTHANHTVLMPKSKK